MSRPRYLENVVTLQLDRKKCIGCGLCATVCPHAVFRMAQHSAIIADRDACMECGACALNCPARAITVAAGVGCAIAVINTALGRTSGECCCVVDPPGEDPDTNRRPPRSGGCC